MRRVMLQIAERLAQKNDCKCLITGESLGQVASQTMEAIAATNEVVKMPILRPLIGLDKQATCDISREIGAFETSILPYEDCCTVFVAKHPKTHPHPDPGLISFRMDWLDLFAVQGTLKSLLQHHSSKAAVVRCSAFFTVQLSHPYMTTGKTIALTRRTFAGKVM